MTLVHLDEAVSLSVEERAVAVLLLLPTNLQTVRCK